MRCLARLSHYIRRAVFALSLCAVIATAPAFAAVQWNRVATVDSSTATANQACYWSGSTLECSSTNPTITATGLVGIGTTAPSGLLDIYNSSGDAILLVESPGASGSAAYLILNYNNAAYNGLQLNKTVLFNGGSAIGVRPTIQ